MVRGLVGTSIVVAAVVALVARPAPSVACSCRPPAYLAWPEQTAPTNTHVYVLTGWESAARKWTLTLYEARDGDELPIAATTRRIASGGFTMIELVPHAPLAPNTHHVVRTDSTKQPIAKFSTTASTDTTPPAWSGTLRAAFVQMRGGSGSCETGSPLAFIDGLGAKDDTPGPLFVGVWVANDRGELDYTRPPALLWGYSAGLVLGASELCSPSNFTFPRRSSLKLGLRIIDQAGNVSRPIDVRFPIAKPLLRERYP